MDRELMEKHGEGIIVLSGCPSGELHRHILDGRIDEAKATIDWYRNVFDGYYLEVMSHDLPEFAQAKKTIVELSREMDVPLVATNDSHYLRVEDHESHDILLCIGTNSTVQEEKRMKMSDPSYYVRSEDEMREAFTELPEAIDNTWKIAEQCDLELEFGRLHMPDPDLPPGVTAEEHLEQLCWEGLRRRLPNADESAEDRLRYELDVIEQTGFTNYIHIVREIGEFARSQNIRMGVRGSAAASLVLYCLGITDIDPLKANLVFERFLNLERPEAPDVDFDFADDRRDEVLRFTANRYGSDRVAQIITFGTLGAKAAVRDTGRALGMGYADTDRVARLIPNALHMTLERALNENAELRNVYEADSQVRNLVDQAQTSRGRGAQRQHARRRRRDQPRAAGGAPAAGAPRAWRPAGDADDPVRHGARRRHRPGQDGLPRPLQPDDPAARRRPHRGASRRHGRPREPAGRRREDVRDAGQRRDVRRVPAGIGGNAPRHGGAQADQRRRPRGAGCALPTRADAAHRYLLPRQARPGADRLPAR